MSTTQPIRNKDKLQEFTDYYKYEKPNIRNYTIIVLGLNTALRIGDLLKLKCDMVYHNKSVRSHIVVREQKTGKENRIFLNDKSRQALLEYRLNLMENRAHMEGNPYLFPGVGNADEPFSRSQAYRMIRAAAEAIDISDNISCHSLRKTFGYHAWKQGSDPIVIMDIFNHSSLRITKRYLCLEQDDKDMVYKKICI